MSQQRSTDKKSGYFPVETVVVLDGASASSAQTEVALSFGGGTALSNLSIGIPVARPMRTHTVAVSWASTNAPGDWTLTLWKRSPGGADPEAAATFTVTTS